MSDDTMVINDLTMRANVTSGNVVVGCVDLIVLASRYTNMPQTAECQPWVMIVDVSNTLMLALMAYRFVEYNAVNSTVICVERRAVVSGTFRSYTPCVMTPRLNSSVGTP